MSDSEKAYKEALRIKQTKVKEMVPLELIDRIKDNYYRVLYCCNVNNNDLIWEKMRRKGAK